jgi:hypothetical protein
MCVLTNVSKNGRDREGIPWDFFQNRLFNGKISSFIFRRFRRSCGLGGGCGLDLDA